MIHAAVQPKLKSYAAHVAAVRVKHCIFSYQDLVFLQTNLRNIKTETCTEELAARTEGSGDCRMMSICGWGHARLELGENLADFDDQDHMGHVGEYKFSVSETCLFAGHFHGSARGTI